MPWQEATAMSLRQEFVQLAQQEGANVRALCRRFGISPPTAYKWLRRAADGDTPLTDRSRRPCHTPARTAPEVETAVLTLRDAHPAWGARKLQARLVLPPGQPRPSASTIHAILRRHGRVDPAHTGIIPHPPWQRFERAAPNELWQMDFKGHLPLAVGGRCHPLTVLDDHSRFAVGLRACADEQAATVQAELTALFHRYGLPAAIVCDNGPPWGDDGDQPYTVLGAWLLRHGVRILHGRPYHPQTQGKDERFHRTLTAELLRDRLLVDLADSQRCFDRWRDVYNLERPHQALAFATPARRYQPSPRPFVESPPPIAYGPDELVRQVFAPGRIHVQGRTVRIGRAFVGSPVALRPTAVDGVLTVVFCATPLGILDLRQPPSSSAEVLTMSPISR
jgi:transposase InsO family protein